MRYVLCLLGLTLFAEQPPPAEPELSLQQIANYYRAHSDRLEAEKREADAVASMVRTCGERGVVQESKNGFACGPGRGRSSDDSK